MLNLSSLSLSRYYFSVNESTHVMKSNPNQQKKKNQTNKNFEVCLFFFETEGQQVSAKAEEAVDHLGSLFFCQVERRFHSREWNANLFLKIWVSLHHLPVV